MRPNPYRDSALEHAVAITRGWPDASEIPSGRKLNLGSGRICLPNEDGWVNVDIVPSEGVDVRCHLLSFPWPFQDNSVDYMLPESFGYLAGQEDDNYDYALPFRFEAINNTPYLMGLPWTGGMTQLQFEQSVQTLWNVVDVMRVDLRPVK